MSGERSNVRALQPGGREAAPGPLALVQTFINSHYDLERDRGADLLATPQSLAAWLERQRLPARPLTLDDVERARAVREGLRALAASNGHSRVRAATDSLHRLNQAAAGAAFEAHFSDNGITLAPAEKDPLDQALAIILATTARAMIDGTWARLKVCPGEHCGWAFYDHSRNQSGRWCSMSVCGGRAKARNHYWRQHARDG
jgi:predicted RNA-binding Zn ribbon-like protein